MQITDSRVKTADIGSPQMLGRYEILRPIGRGGMSIVYAARDGETGQTVAVKLLTMPPTLTPAQQRDMIIRFGREAKAVARVSHPNIITLDGIGEQNGRHFLVTEYVNGQTVRQRIDDGPLSPADALSVITQVADALAVVHKAGIVHCDVKSSNVMLLPDGSTKLLDFGVARQHTDTPLGSARAIIGSPAYMAPEQVRGEPGTTASDVWGLGVLLYEMLASRPPFTGKTIPEVLTQVTQASPPPIAGVSAPIQKVLCRSLNKNPSRRYPTPEALAGALRNALPEFRPAKRLSKVWLALTIILLAAGLAGFLGHRSLHARAALTRPAAVPAPVVHPVPPVTTSPTAPATKPKAPPAPHKVSPVKQTPPRTARTQPPTSR